MRLTGRISKWMDAGYGYISVRQNTPEGPRMCRYYLHVSKIIGLPDGMTEPMTGCPVEFEPTNNFKRQTSDIPSAIDAIVGAPSVESVVLQVLAGKADAQ